MPLQHHRWAIRLAGVAAAAATLAVGPVALRAGAAPAPPPPPAPTLQWTEASPANSPPALAYAAAAYDGALSSLVVFGGVRSDGTLSDHTWVWTGQSWLDQGSSPGLSGRYLASMAYDPQLNQLILFGGQTADGTFLGDTWAWNGRSWVPVSDQGPTPSAREAAAMAYDRSGNLVLFGGTGYTGGTGATSSGAIGLNGGTQTVLGDTWRWTNQGWVQSTAKAPPARSGAVLVYDGARHDTVLYGGESTAAATAPAKPLSDTWIWDGSTWSKATPAASPPGRFGALADYLPGAGGPVLLTGAGAGADMADAWVWTGGDWAQARLQGLATPRQGAAGGFDTASGAIVLFGGTRGGGATLSDTALVSSVPTRPAPTTTTTASPPTSVASPAPTTPGHPRPARATTTTIPRSAVRPAPRPPSDGGTGAPVEAPTTGALLVEANIHSVHRGARVQLAGSGFAPGTRVELSFHSTPRVLGWTTADASGHFSTAVAVPDNAAPGEHRIVATGTGPTGSPTELTAVVFILAPHHHGLSTATTLFLVGLALLIPVAAYLAMAGLGVWRQRRRRDEPQAV